VALRHLFPDVVTLLDDTPLVIPTLSVLPTFRHIVQVKGREGTNAHALS
jgi:hypothetical protein